MRLTSKFKVGTSTGFNWIIDVRNITLVQDRWSMGSGLDYTEIISNHKIIEYFIRFLINSETRRSLEIYLNNKGESQ